MKLFIPAISTKLVLTQPWTFTLFGEGRNYKFIDALYKSRAFTEFLPEMKLDADGYPVRLFTYNAKELCDLTLPIGTELIVSRVYIRLGQKSFDSITFNGSVNVINSITKKPIKVKGRFWVKLADANTMEVSVTPTPKTNIKST